MSEHAADAAHHAGEAVHHGAAGIKGGLGKKLGPMPVGGWLLAVGGGVLVAYYFRSRSGNGGGTDTTDTTATDAADLPDATGWDQADPGGTNQGAGNLYDPTTNDPSSNTTGDTGSTSGGASGGGGGGSDAGPSQAHLARQATTNAAWAKHAVKAMQPFGFAPDHTAATLAAFLAGDKLTQGQTVTLAATESRCGPPPHPPHHQAPPGTPPPAPTPTHHHRDTGGHTPPTKPHHHK
jgi:hypothetical protein